MLECESHKGVTALTGCCGRCPVQAGLVAYLEGQLHGGALEEGRQTYPGYLVVATSAVGLLLSGKAKEGGLLNTALAGLLNSIYVAKLALLVLPQVCTTKCHEKHGCGAVFTVLSIFSRSLLYEGLCHMYRCCMMQLLCSVNGCLFCWVHTSQLTSCCTL